MRGGIWCHEGPNAQGQWGRGARLGVHRIPVMSLSEILAPSVATSCINLTIETAVTKDAPLRSARMPRLQAHRIERAPVEGDRYQ
jgi:hypothetical protein